MKKWLKYGGFMALAGLAGCQMPEPVHENWQPQPLTYDKSAERQRPYQSQWWQLFGSDELNRLVTVALTDNARIEVLLARLEQAEARVGLSQSAQQFTLDYNGTASYGRRRGPTGQERFDRESYESALLGLAGSYEVDVWGRLKAEEQAALKQVEASTFDLEALQMTLTGSLVQQWVNYQMLLQQQQVLSQQLALNEDILTLLETRFKSGQIAALDVLQQKQLVQQSRTLLIQNQEAVQLAVNSLALLCGKTSSQFEDPGLMSEPLLLPSTPDQGVPAELLTRRPDLAALLSRLESASWNLQSVKLDKLPKIQLGISAAFQAADWGQLLKGWDQAVNAAVVGPILDGGRREANIDLAQAQFREWSGLFQEQWLTAVQEVENALVQLNHADLFAASVDEELAMAKAASEEAFQRYQGGIVNYLTVITELIKLQRVQLTQINAKQNQFTARIALFRALGGDWKTSTAQVIEQSVDAKNLQKENSK